MGSERDTKAILSLWVSDLRKDVHGKLIGLLEKKYNQDSFKFKRLA